MILEFVILSVITSFFDHGDGVAAEIWSRPKAKGKKPSKKVPTGNGSYSSVVEDGCQLVDKTELIMEFLQSQPSVYVIARPSRFGKSINLSMLRTFLDRRINSSELFDGTLISRQPHITDNYQNTHPVIFVSFKDCAAHSYNETLNKIGSVLADLYVDHNYLIPNLDERDTSAFQNIVIKNTTELELEHALAELSHYLNLEFNKCCYVFIDDYDTMILEAYFNGFHSQLLPFLVRLFSSVLNGNPNLEKAALAGVFVYQVSGQALSNVRAATVLDPIMIQHFGFQESEAKELTIAGCRRDGSILDFVKLRSVYGGHRFAGGWVLFNPGSVTKAIDRRRIGRYWSLTPADVLVRKLVFKKGALVRNALELLLENRTVQKALGRGLNLDKMSQEKYLWTTLVYAGYLNAVFSHEDKKTFDLMYNLNVPNLEVLKMLKENLVAAFS